MKHNFLYVFFALVASLFFVSSDYENAILILMTLVLIICFFKTKIFDKNRYLLIVAVNILSIVVTLLLFPGLGSGLLLADIIIAMFIFNNTIITSKEFFILHAILGLLLVYYLLDFDYESVATGLLVGTSNSVSLNANGFGIISLAIFLHFSCLIPYLKKRFLRILFFAMMAASAGSVIFLSGSRLSLFSFGAFILVSLLLKKDVSIKVNHRCIRTILLAGLVLPFIYIYMFGIYKQQELLGKNFFSGRQYLWMDAINGIEQHPLFGSGTSILMYDGTLGYTDNTHNMMLGILKMFGVIPVITIFKFLFYDRNKIEARLYYMNKTALWAFTCCILVSLGEAFLTDMHLCFLFLSFLLNKIAVKPTEKINNIITV